MSTSPERQMQHSPDRYKGTGARSDAEYQLLEKAQRHAAIVAPDGIWWLTRQQRGPIESMSDLKDFANQVVATEYMRPTGGKVAYVDDNGKNRTKHIGEYPQIWILGEQTRQILGWDNEFEQGETETDAEFFERMRREFPKQVKATLDPFLGSGWTLVTQEPDFFVGLRKDLPDGTWYRINIVNAAMAWMPIRREDRNEHGNFGILGVDNKPGSQLPVEDDVLARQELARRLAWHVEHLGTLPSQSPSATGASIQDLETARKKKRDDVIGAPTLLPSLEDMPGEDAEPEPAVEWTLNTVPNELLRDRDGAEIDAFIRIDQTASFLGSAGMVAVGYGEQYYLTGDEAIAFIIDREQPAKAGGKPKINAPAGLYRITLPAGRWLVAEKGIPDAYYRGPDEDAGTGYLPWPHPAMRDEQPVTTWVTAPTLNILREPVAAGGCALTLDELDVQVAHVWEHETFMLSNWQKTIRDARAVAVETGDTAMYDNIKAIYTGYIGRMKYSRHWKFAAMAHHHQPILRASIIAHARNRGRRYAAKLAAEYGRWPINTDTDSWVYTARAGEIFWAETWATRDQHSEPITKSTRCGAFVVEKIARLGADITDEQMTAVLIAETPFAVKDAVKAFLPTTKGRKGADGDQPDDPNDSAAAAAEATLDHEGAQQ